VDFDNHEKKEVIITAAYVLLGLIMIPLLVNSLHLGITVPALAASVIFKIPVGSQPTSVAFDRVNGLLYVPDFGSSDVKVIKDTAVIATVPISPLPEIPTAGPEFAAADTFNHLIYVTDYAARSVSMINGDTNSLFGTPIRVGNNPNGIVFNPFDGLIYVTNRGDNTVSVIKNTAVIAIIPVGLEPVQLAVLDKNHCVYVANLSGNSISVICGLKVVATLKADSPAGIVENPLNSHLYVTDLNSGTVSVINPFNGAMDLCPSPINLHSITPTGIGYDGFNGRLYVTNDNSGPGVSIIKQCNVVDSAFVGISPDGVAFNALNSNMYIAADGSNTVYKLSQ
jgi:YVTN family beta-propeller protein